MNITAIRQAIATKLKELNIETYSFIPDSLNPPCAYVRPGDFMYTDSYGGTVQFPMIVQIICPSVDTKDGQEQLDALIDPQASGSVVTKLRETETLSGTVQSMRVLQHRAYGTVVHAETGVKYWSAEIVLDCLA